MYHLDGTELAVVWCACVYLSIGTWLLSGLFIIFGLLAGTPGS